MSALHQASVDYMRAMGGRMSEVEARAMRLSHKFGMLKAIAIIEAEVWRIPPGEIKSRITSLFNEASALVTEEIKSKEK